MKHISHFQPCQSRKISILTNDLFVFMLLTRANWNTLSIYQGQPLINQFWPMSPFLYPMKRKRKAFLVFPGGIEKKH